MRFLIDFLIEYYRTQNYNKAKYWAKIQKFKRKYANKRTTR